MNRITISLVKELEEQLREIQGGLIQNRKKDISFTTTINMVLLSGILSVNDFSNNTWTNIQKFIDDEKISFNSDILINEFINKLK